MSKSKSNSIKCIRKSRVKGLLQGVDDDILRAFSVELHLLLLLRLLEQAIHEHVGKAGNEKKVVDSDVHFFSE
jgi:hypothetical protein